MGCQLEQELYFFVCNLRRRCSKRRRHSTWWSTWRKHGQTGKPVSVCITKLKDLKVLNHLGVCVAVVLSFCGMSLFFVFLQWWPQDAAEKTAFQQTRALEKKGSKIAAETCSFLVISISEEFWRNHWTSLHVPTSLCCMLTLSVEEQKDARASLTEVERAHEAHKWNSTRIIQWCTATDKRDHWHRDSDLFKHSECGAVDKTAVKSQTRLQKRRSKITKMPHFRRWRVTATNSVKVLSHCAGVFCVGSWRSWVVSCSAVDPAYLGANSRPQRVDKLQRRKPRLWLIKWFFGVSWCLWWLIMIWDILW